MLRGKLIMVSHKQLLTDCYVLVKNRTAMTYRCPAAGFLFQIKDVRWQLSKNSIKTSVFTLINVWKMCITHAYHPRVCFVMKHKLVQTVRLCRNAAYNVSARACTYALQRLAHKNACACLHMPTLCAGCIWSS